MIHGMNHFTVLSDDLDKTLGFYVDLLGLKPGPRPDLGFPGHGCTRGRLPSCTSLPGARYRHSARESSIIWRSLPADWRT